MARKGRSKNKSVSNQAISQIQRVVEAMKESISPYVVGDILDPDRLDEVCTVQSAHQLIDYLTTAGIYGDGISFMEAQDHFEKGKPSKSSKADKVINLLKTGNCTLILDGDCILVNGLTMDNPVHAAFDQIKVESKPSNVVSISEAPSAPKVKVDIEKPQKVWSDYQVVRDHFSSKYRLTFRKVAPMLSQQRDAQERISNIWNNDDLSLYEKEFSILNILELQSYHDRLKKDPEDSPQRVARKNMVPEETALERLTRAIRHDAICFGIVYVALAFPVILTYGLTLALTQQLFFFGIIIPVFSIWVGGKIGWKTPRLFTK